MEPLSIVIAKSLKLVGTQQETEGTLRWVVEGTRMEKLLTKG